MLLLCLQPRGVRKAVFERGGQERELANKWRNRAGIIGLGWPGTKSMLQRIATSWEMYARQEDQRARKDRLRF
jgi:predicted YcjX-like family ATPase